MEVSEEVRLRDNSRRFDKAETGIALQQQLPKAFLRPLDCRWRIGAGYSAIVRQNSSYERFLQHRAFFQASVTKKVSDWRFGFRARYQATFRNPLTGDYLDNPKEYLRFRLEARCSLPHAPWSFSLSEECYCHIAYAKGNRIDEWRTRLEAARDLNSRHSIALYLLLIQETNVKSPLTTGLIGFAYQFH